ncbi:MAG TPA: NAD-dependent epimerase/dehydratase family protein, partial [Candidatus Hydrogenedentes bacterium]|nr:NAD-dependent epimerase/dehydratase family protein [Candidatus Hydrogenedentota bacterium]
PTEVLKSGIEKIVPQLAPTEAAFELAARGMMTTDTHPKQSTRTAVIGGKTVRVSGCSKGAADQYVRDYARIYELPTTVYRQSCIYGYRQFGVEDQGWVAWFVIAAVLGRPITIYGNGKQVRDVLFVDDLVEAYLAAIARPETVAGKIFNVGGGPENTMSVWAEFGPMLEELIGRPVSVAHGDWRPGDQPVYISDIRKIARELGWQPKIAVRDGVQKLYEWVAAHRDLFKILG